MEWYYILLIVLGGIILLGILPLFLVSNRIYSVLFIRCNKKKWSRTVSWDDEELRKMFAIGKSWGEKYDEYRKTICINSCGFNLVAEYFDFGNDKAVIVVPGRMESGTYSYYFSEPYRKLGYNVLAIDNRSHGLSEGRYNTLGLKEYKDILNWTRHLQNNENINHVIIHGICIGSATGLYALIDKEAPSNLKGLIAEGMYTSFKETLDNNLKKRNKPVFPFSPIILWMMHMVSGKNVKKNGPIYKLEQLDKPILFMYSKEDTFSTHGEDLYNKVRAPKKLVWFPKGVHSHIRIHNTEKYDQTITDFVKEYIK